MTLWIALGALTGLLGTLLYFHRQGKASGRSDALLESFEAKNKAMKEASNVEDSVRGMSDGTVHDERVRWNRD
jgi:hypothetical protein